MAFALNSRQQEAVRYIDGPLLVLAGAGSGKTRVITAKIAHLVTSGVDAARIAAITFTNKAAKEMRERSAKLLASNGVVATGAAGPSISTFHALGLRIVRSEAALLGLSSRFSIFDPGDIEPIVIELLQTSDRARARAAQWRISQWKNALVTPAQALAEATDENELAAARVFTRYDEALRAYQAVDFDDLIALPVALLEREPEAAARWSERFRYLLIDEYQDTNAAQYRLLRLLAGGRGAFTAVGDDDQAIYGWRGASVENINVLARDYPGLQVIKLEQNYRSAVRILRSANALIANNVKLFDKRLWSELGLGDAIRVTPCVDDESEAELVAMRIAAGKFEHRSRYGDFAVLYRGNHQARVFERALRAQNVPYTVSGGQSWFEKSEVKDIVAYLRLIANDDDDPAFVRAITTPKRGIGAQTLDRLGQAGRRLGSSLFAAIFEEDVRSELPSRQREALDSFAALISGLRYRAEREPAGRLLDELLASIAYEDFLFSTLDKADAQRRSDTVREFVAWLSRKGESDEQNLLELTQKIALLTMLEGQEGEAPDAVHLSTLHAAKGLEFGHVFLVGVEEGILPHREAVANGNVEEERRLMYVGITRAQSSLQISWCRKRKRHGEWQSGEASRFIGELAQDDLRHASMPLEASDAAREKEAGQARLRSMRERLAR